MGVKKEHFGCTRRSSTFLPSPLVVGCDCQRSQKKTKRSSFCCVVGLSLREGALSRAAVETVDPLRSDKHVHQAHRPVHEQDVGGVLFVKYHPFCVNTSFSSSDHAANLLPASSFLLWINGSRTLT